MVNQSNKQPQLKIVSKTPALATDGHFLSISNEGNVELTFFQISKKTTDSVEVAGVTSIRLTLDQLKLFGKTIDNVIKTHEEKKASEKKNKTS
jgi:hypothetical protein